MACIYQIRNLVNNKIYIGSTQKDNSFRRRGEHFGELRNNNHCNKHLQASFNKTGEDNFVFEIIEELKFPSDYTKEFKYEYIMGREIYYITKLNPQYNIMREITGGKLGRIPSEKEKEYLRVLFTGRTVLEGTKSKIRKARANQIITEEHKRKTSKSLEGNKNCLGHKQSEQQKQNNSLRVLEHNKAGIGMHSMLSKEKRTNSLKEKFNTPEMKIILQKSARDRNRRLFYCFKEGELIGEFTSQIEAAEYLGFKKPWGISSVLNGIQNTHKGYTFNYKLNS